MGPSTSIVISRLFCAVHTVTAPVYAVYAVSSPGPNHRPYCTHGPRAVGEAVAGSLPHQNPCQDGARDLRGASALRSPRSPSLARALPMVSFNAHWALAGAAALA